MVQAKFWLMIQIPVLVTALIHIDPDYIFLCWNTLASGP